jgi:hypothetical protein
LAAALPDAGSFWDIRAGAVMNEVKRREGEGLGEMDHIRNLSARLGKKGVEPRRWESIALIVTLIFVKSEFHSCKAHVFILKMLESESSGCRQGLGSN